MSRKPSESVSKEERRCRAAIVEENFRRLAECFNLKEVTRERLREIATGKAWRIFSAKSQPEWQGLTYRWQQASDGPNQKRQPREKSWIVGRQFPACQGTWHASRR